MSLDVDLTLASPSWARQVAEDLEAGARIAFAEDCALDCLTFEEHAGHMAVAS